MAIITKAANRLIREYDNETLLIEPWGKNSLRVRATKNAAIKETDWALLPQDGCEAQIEIDEQSAKITNGRITAVLDRFGCLTFVNQKGDILLQEYWRVKESGEKTSALEISGREFKPIIGGDYRVTLRFESNDREKIYGLGQRQERQLDMKGCMLELAQRNSQASVPFALSNIGYGFLWNNPAIGRVTFGANLTEWRAEVSEQMDYWITAGDTPAQIEEAYADVTGKTPMMPAFATGFWQCKLRYKTQDELLSVAREHKRRGIPLSVIVCDFFHWPQQGEWKFDPEFWPDPAAMVRELREMGVELMVSIWPTVDVNSENYDEMVERGYLLRTERATRTNINFLGNESFYDATHPGARKFVWDKVKEHYYDAGIRLFWLDEAEPDLMGHYDYDHFRYYLGPAMKVGNLYPFYYARTFYDGMTAAGQENILNLIRCVWAGSQRFGTLLWSGDIVSTFECLRKQVAAGLNAGISGIPWWTTDIGGFFGGDPSDPQFRELLIRWFQFGLFCPVCRLHGLRLPYDFKEGDSAKMFNEPFGSGADNEVWSFGEEAYDIIKDILFARERLRPYITEQMKVAHEKGTPVIRPLFYDFPEDEKCWDIEDEYMFGPDVLVAPILYQGMMKRTVYLPAGRRWKDARTQKEYEGGAIFEYDAPIGIIPVFVAEGKEMMIFAQG
ncbi:MAG TPA: glycoside hydrolase family 31 protein [Feifaniaceae bacterium]|nr:glycoside hydrolase family 31 protein [Feifaniaceae bacterium]